MEKNTTQGYLIDLYTGVLATNYKHKKMKVL